MKKYLCLLVFIVIGACDNDNGDGGADINSITLNPQKISTPVTERDPGPYSVWFVMSGNTIFYMNPSNTPEEQFMFAYDIETNTFTEKAINDEICACGLMSKPVSDGSFLYYAGNGGVKYSIEENVWSEISYPENVEMENNGTGVVYNDNKVYYAGGSDVRNKFKYYDIPSDTWFNALNMPYAVIAPNMVAVNNKIYMLGGDEANNRFSVYTENEGWTELDDLAFTSYNGSYTPMVTAYKDRYIVLLSDNQINIYDTKTGVWKDSPIELGNIESSNQGIFANGDNLYIAALSSTHQFSLYKMNF